MSETKQPGALVRSALIRAQAQMETAKKASKNPHFNSAYADLASVAATVRGPFAAHGLGWRHDVSSDADGVYVACIIFHESGEEILPAKPLFLPVPKKDPQAYKSGVTYGKRTTLEAAAGIATDEDDDGNAATAGGPTAPAKSWSEGQRIAAEPPPRKPSRETEAREQIWGKTAAPAEDGYGDSLQLSEPPPQDEQHEKRPGPKGKLSPAHNVGEDPIPGYGSAKTDQARLSELTDKSLLWYLKTATENAEKPGKYQSNNRAFLEAVRSHVASRGLDE